MESIDAAREILSEQELRVIGCLIEKERTTPDLYPLTLNALVNACNQKSNRSPVVTYAHADVSRVLDDLRWKGWIVVVDEAGSRAEKYRHRFAEKTGLGEKEVAVLAELMLRGPQTAGELRGRANRMAALAGIEEVQAILSALEGAEPRRVVRLSRRTGFKERRWTHLLAGEPAAADDDAPAERAEEPSGAVHGSARAAGLEEEIASLRARVEALEGAVEELRSRVG